MLFEDRSLAPYQGNEPYLFLSYSHRNADAAAAGFNRLNELRWKLGIIIQINQIIQFIYFIDLSDNALIVCIQQMIRIHQSL